MKCLIPVLAMIIFMIQIHAIFILVPPEKRKEEDSYSDYLNNSSKTNFNNLNQNKMFIKTQFKKDSNNQSLLITNFEKLELYSNFSNTNNIVNNNYEEESEEDCSDFLINCICKCGLAFLAGVLFSDMKFIKFGVI